MGELEFIFSSHCLHVSYFLYLVYGTYEEKKKKKKKKHATTAWERIVLFPLLILHDPTVHREFF